MLRDTPFDTAESALAAKALTLVHADPSDAAEVRADKAAMVAVLRAFGAGPYDQAGTISEPERALAEIEARLEGWR